MLVLLNVMLGNFSTSRKSALFRCASRWSSSVLMLAASITASMLDPAGFPRSTTTEPFTVRNPPRTFVTIMWRTTKWALECAESILYVVFILAPLDIKYLDIKIDGLSRGKDSGIAYRNMGVKVADKKDPAAVALGRKGGKKGGPARAAQLTPQQRSESARNAVQARWAKAKRSSGAKTQITQGADSGVDTSDTAVLALLKRLKKTSDRNEIRQLSDQLERVIFHR